jgi:hypothetical protein
MAMVSITRELSPAGKNLLIALRELKNKQARVGWFEHSRYEDGTPVASIAAQNEYGNPAQHIPARPFMRPTAVSKAPEWKKIAYQGAKAILNNTTTTADVFEILAKKVVFDIQKTIAALQTPPLSPATIAARLHRKSDKKTIGSLTKPLIDTGVMFGTLIYKIEDAP